MKLLTLNFLTCAIKTCKTQPASFPLHPRDAELEIVETDMNLPFLKNILPRLMWDELRTITSELGLPDLPPTPPTRSNLVEGGEKDAVAEEEEQEEVVEEPTQTAKDLHRILLETCIKEGKLVCGACGHEYKVMEGVANFLLPGHLV
ncbi:Trm112p-domain-containing protein [Lentithecium fluviatile CBS 122367]|uniref:Trm112p-domain-containing protein n=1 Tax=Lentithecium fluviatile CBS 122367 TaxID=1168545 RepID=A0A6G1J2M2_9PLEO|nr:Trm112p-domain-containing protein [Lentithecium fluviatile CBS 122367]